MLMMIESFLLGEESRALGRDVIELPFSIYNNVASGCTIVTLEENYITT